VLCQKYVLAVIPKRLRRWKTVWKTPWLSTPSRNWITAKSLQPICWNGSTRGSGIK